MEKLVFKKRLYVTKKKGNGRELELKLGEHGVKLSSGLCKLRSCRENKIRKQRMD